MTDSRFEVVTRSNRGEPLTYRGIVFDRLYRDVAFMCGPLDDAHQHYTRHDARKCAQAALRRIRQGE